MAPTLLLFYPDIAKSLIQYRLDRIAGYKIKAASYSNPSYDGICVSWESALTGVECCPHNCCASCTREIHNNGDVALFMRQYFSLQSGIPQNFTMEVFSFMSQSATFWLSRVEENSDGSFSIHDIVPPDEFADHVTDSVITNLGASLALNWTSVLADQLSLAVNPEWKLVASRLRLPFDATNQRFLEYSNYSGAQIKQADAVLMRYPFGYEISDAVQLNGLNFYTNVTTQHGPAMTWSVTAINYLSLPGHEATALEFFNKSYATYVRYPFLIWFETPTGGTSNFITGAGGFLQALPFGYGGIEIDATNGINLRNLPNSDVEFSLNGISFKSCFITISFKATTVSLSLTTDCSLNIAAKHLNQAFNLTTATPTDLPRDGKEIQIRTFSPATA